MGDLLLKEYAPRSTLELDEHLVEKPRFAAIDAHNHLGPWMKDRGVPDVPTLIRMMDQGGIRGIVNLEGGWGDRLQEHLDMYDRAYPGRFASFAHVDWSRLDEPGFGEKMATQLEQSVATGARGLKIFKELGLGYRDKTGRLVSPDDQRWDPIWAKAGELGVPVMIHLSDPMCFWQPFDRFNEAYLVLEDWVDCRYHEREVPAYRELVDAGIRLIRRHPDTTFIAAHTGWFESLRFVSKEMLDALPNLCVDISACLAFLGPQPYTAREFLIKYQDRVLFGTDALPSPDRYRVHYRWLETADEYFEIGFGPPYASRHFMYGVYLPDDVLQKIYYKNAERVIPSLAWRS